jgi:L-asparaginase
MLLHIASRLEQCKNYTEDLHSVGAIDITDINDDKIKEISKAYPHEEVKPTIDLDRLTLKNSVLMITPYVGVNYGAYDYSRFSAVLHGTYHSGTACVEEKTSERSILYMIDKCSAMGVDCFFAPSKDYGEIYHTISDISKFRTENGKRIGFLYGMTNEAAYAKLLVAYSYFDDKESLKEYIHTECNFEYFDR